MLELVRVAFLFDEELSRSRRVPAAAKAWLISDSKIRSIALEKHLILDALDKWQKQGKDKRVRSTEPSFCDQ